MMVCVLGLTVRKTPVDSQRYSTPVLSHLFRVSGFGFRV